MTEATVEATVVVVGSVNVDLVVRAARLPAAGETVTGGAFARHGGGKGANQAVAARRAGAKVHLIGAVGDDDLGRNAVEELVREGIDVGAVRVVAGVPTGVAVIVVDDRGENLIAVAPGANQALGRVDVDRWQRAAMPRTPWVCLLDLEVPDPPLIAAARAARAAGAALLVNPAPARQPPDEVLDAGPILTPNRLEATALSGASDPTAAARALRARTGRPVLVTLGADGVLVVDERGSRTVAAYRVRAVDTTGAGDAFSGALAASLAAGRSLDDAVPRAIAAGALSVTVPGARDGMPTADAIEAFLAAHD